MGPARPLVSSITRGQSRAKGGHTSRKMNPTRLRTRCRRGTSARRSSVALHPYAPAVGAPADSAYHIRLSSSATTGGRPSTSYPGLPCGAPP